MQISHIESTKTDKNRYDMKKKSQNTKQNQYYNNEFIKIDTIFYRAYQKNLMDECFNSNSLIVLPTALGKTIIAVMTAAKHLVTYTGAKVLMLAPTKPLVAQHFETFQQFMTSEIKMQMLIGGISPLKRALSLNQSQILFSTPQIIKNDLIKGSYNLRDFSLIIFDETHKARKNYAYTFIAEEYMKTGKKPYILGLTASPGKDAEIINTLIQKLYIEKVCFKTENHNDVKEYIYPIDLYVEKIDLPIEVVEIQALLKTATQEIIDYFIGKKLLPVKDYYSKVDFIRLNQDFRNFELYGDNYPDYNFSDVPIVLTANPLNRFAFISMCITGIYLLHMEEILTTQTPKMFIDYCEKLKIRAGLGSKSAKRIINGKYFREFINTQQEFLENIESPKIQSIIDIVKSIFKEKASAKIIIFTQFRDMASIVKEKLENLESPYIKPERFIGQFSKPGDRGLTQNKQQEIIRTFKKLDISVLIATSIAEEGLDIPDVDAVIFYEPVPSEIRLIQRRGRTGRRSRGQCHIICARDTLDDIYLKVAFRKEAKMKETLISEEELEVLTNIERDSKEFVPDNRPDEEIMLFFKDLEAQKKMTAEKKVEMLNSVNKLESEQKRRSKFKNYGINDLTQELGELSKKRLEKTAKNIEERKKEKYQKYLERRKQKMEEKIKLMREKKNSK